MVLAQLEPPECAMLRFAGLNLLDDDSIFALVLDSNDRGVCEEPILGLLVVIADGVRSVSFIFDDLN
jgi:hypothetical protein